MIDIVVQMLLDEFQAMGWSIFFVIPILMTLSVDRQIERTTNRTAATRAGSHG